MTLPTTVTALGKLNPLAVHTVLLVDGSQSCTRLLNVSATTTSAPNDAMPYGQSSWLGPLPWLPRLRPVALPERSNSVNRKFLVSATHTVFVTGLIVRSRGQLKPALPSPNPRVPQSNCGAPLAGSKTSTR